MSPSKIKGILHRIDIRPGEADNRKPDDDGLLDMGTAYPGTSPGAMSALIVPALESGKGAAVITCFHFFRVVFIILTMPIIFKYFFR
ncbi:MAG: AbrB family transcriptional regulator [Deltaproteobacteria bacterium]|nr:AbrB family transcriptional regulator [Deltaproteobacteria bacterium]